MFYCELCAEKNNWPKGLTTSVGVCENCGEPEDCYDVPSSALPKSKTQIQSMIGRLEKIQTAASFDAHHNLPSLMQFIGYRQKVAQDLLKATGENYEKLESLFDHTNEQIKKILGI